MAVIIHAYAVTGHESCHMFVEERTWSGLLICMSKVVQYAHSQHLTPHTGVWTHVVWTIARPTPTATTGTYTVYVNGALIGTVTGQFPVETHRNYIGMSNWAGETPFVGSLDEFAIFPLALSAREAFTLFKSVELQVGRGTTVW
jgi:hypothetical protein